jgi:hypothetical protein
MRFFTVALFHIYFFSTSLAFGLGDSYPQNFTNDIQLTERNLEERQALGIIGESIFTLL